MKKLILFTTFILVIISLHSQTLYVPNTLGGISSSNTSNIGIGINSPSELLHLKSLNTNFRLESTNNTANSIHNNIQLYSARISSGDKIIGRLTGYSVNSSGQYIERAAIEYNTSGGKGYYWQPPTNIIFRTNTENSTSNLQRMIITHDGKIGIGNVTPSALVHISNSQTSLRLQATSSTAPTNEIEFYSEKIPNGDKIIGKLAGYSKGSDGTYTSRASIEFGTDSEKGWYWQPPTNIVFRTNTENSTANLPRLIISHNGNVLIGKTQQVNTAYILDVNGTIRANEIKVNLDGADFVFEENYNLRSLKDVEDFINKNKHLPEIESASEMQKNGAELGDLNQKLLQKIEELTLYMINMNKEVNELKKENSKLKEEINSLR